MALAEQQRLLARLYTDDRTRRRFFEAPGLVALELQLAPSDLAQCAGLSAGEVQGFAQSLRRKRANDLAKLLPATRRVLGGRFLDLAGGDWSRSRPSSARHVAGEAMAFVNFLGARTVGSVPVEEWELELARYEAARVVAARQRLSVRWFRFRVGRIWEQVMSGQRPAAPRRCPTLAVWYRGKMDGELGHFLCPSWAGGRRWSFPGVHRDKGLERLIRQWKAVK